MSQRSARWCEAEIRGTSAEQRRAARQGRAKPLVETLKTWLEKTLVQHTLQLADQLA